MASPPIASYFPFTGIHTPIRYWVLTYSEAYGRPRVFDWSPWTVRYKVAEGGIVVGIRAPDKGCGDSHAYPGKDTLAAKRQRHIGRK